MRNKLVLMLLLVSGLAVSSGCYMSTGSTKKQAVRRVMIAGEQVKLMGQDVDRLFGLEEYPTLGRWQ